VLSNYVSLAGQPQRLPRKEPYRCVRSVRLWPRRANAASSSKERSRAVSQPEVIDRLVRLRPRLRLVRPDQPKTKAKTAPKVKTVNETAEHRVLPTIWDRYYDADD